MNKYEPNLFSSEPPTPGFMPGKDEDDLERIHRLGTLATAINNCVTVWKDKSIELANFLKSAREEFKHDKASQRAWKTWVKKEVKLGESRVRDLLQIAYSDDPEEAVLRLREKGKARSKNFRRRQLAYSTRKSQRISEVIERELFIDWIYAAHPDEVTEMWAETQKRFPVPTKSDELYEIDMHIYVLGTDKLDVLSVARSLRVGRIQALRLQNYAVKKEWVKKASKLQWERLYWYAKPRTLLEFLKWKGGIKEYDGELRNMELNKIVVSEFGSLVNNKTGMTLDNARKAALDAGYLRDSGILTGQPSESLIDDLLDLMKAEVRGEFCFSRNDEEDAAAFLADHRRELAIEKYGAESFAIGEKYGHAIWEFLNVHAKTPADYFPGVLLRAQELLRGKYTVEDAIGQADAELNSPSTDELIDDETISEVLKNWPPKDQPAVLGTSSDVETASEKIE